MNKQYNRSIFVFRRDLRIQDNTGLQAALEKSEMVIPCFILDQRQIGSANAYKSDNALQFMFESLVDLAQQLQQHGGKLYIFKGIAEKFITQLIKQEKANALFFNKDYTPFSLERDNALQKIALHHKCTFESFGDVLLNEPNVIKKGDGGPYTIFTPFYKKSRVIEVRKPITLHATNFYTQPILHAITTTELKKLLKNSNKAIAAHGGSAQGHKILKNLNAFDTYKKDKDYPAKKTSRLSAHLKFGTVSIRQTYHAISSTLGKGHPLLRQLYWRDFFTHLVCHFPHVLGHAFHRKYDHLWWSNSNKNFDAWRNGMTGFPIVDAGMRELVATGFMHNRVRMIVASFLTKDLHIDWRKGEKFFAQHLVDYDPALNNGNWQWCASTGADAQPYFRIFNPWLQQKRFDAECLYIKQWVPELKAVPIKTIHALYKAPNIKNYPNPIVDHAREAALAKQIYKKASRKSGH